jgi:hypothetical protein
MVYPCPHNQEQLYFTLTLHCEKSRIMTIDKLVFEYRTQIFWVLIKGSYGEIS